MKINREMPFIGTIAAITATTILILVGLSDFACYVLFPLVVLFSLLQRMRLREIGFKRGNGRSYIIAILYPVIIMFLLTLAARLFGVVDITDTDWNKSIKSIAIMTLLTFAITLVTEDAFFRGWLWSSIERTGKSRLITAIWTGIAFALWHISVVLFMQDFQLPPARIPIYILNCAVAGFVFTLLRWISGSVLVPSISHGIWNGICYELFGTGTEVAALGIKDTTVFSPESGILGFLFNILFAVLLLTWILRSNKSIGDSRDGSLI
jgi:membrane protease YdiL (CAAX protease family)